MVHLLNESLDSVEAPIEIIEVNSVQNISGSKWLVRANFLLSSDLPGAQWFCMVL